MKNNNLIRFAQSLVLLPIITMSFPFSGTSSLQTPQNELAKQVNTEASGTIAFNQAFTPEANLVSAQIVKNKAEAEAEAIDAYFAEHDMPLKGTGATMVEEAYINNLDWRLLPAIAVRESTGGKNACDTVKYNPFGWNSCKTGFNSYEEAIETVAKNLGGKNPNTAHNYVNKGVKEILNVYNPPSIVPKYADQVISIMNTIGDVDMTPTLASAVNI
jgi:hypothetical protein